MANETPVNEALVEGQLRADRHLEALSALRSLAEVPSDDQPGYAELVPVVEALVRGASAEAYFRLAEEVEAPTDLEPAVYACVGRALESEGHRELAASAWASAEDDALAERSLTVREDLGLDDESFERRLDGLAVDHYRARVTREPRDASAWEALGRKLLNRDQPAGALEAAEKAIALDNSRVWAWVTAGQALARTGRTEDALRRLEEAGRVHPTRAEPLVEAAAVHLARRNEAEALGCYRRALGRDPGDRDAQAGAREILRRGQRWDELARLLETMIPGALDDEEAEGLRTERDELRSGRHRFQLARSVSSREIQPVQEPVALPTPDAGIPGGLAGLVQKPTRDPLARLPNPPGARVGRYLWLAFMLGVGALFVRWLMHSH